MKKVKIIMSCFVLFLAFLILLFLLQPTDTPNYEPGPGISHFYVESAPSSEERVDLQNPSPYLISWLEINGIHYLMLPNSADVNQLVVHFQADDPVFVEGVELFSGVATDLFANRSNTPILLTSGDYQYHVVVMEGSEIATLFIQTESGHLENIHEDQDYRETAQLLMIDEDGETILFDGEADRFNGRGNSTWLQDKRPYNIRLTESTNLLGVEGADHRHWALLADAMDSSRIRNTTAHHLAQDLNLEAAVRVRPVDVYINNEYMGLYLLTERVRIDTILPITDLEEITETVNERPLSEFDHVGNLAFEPGARRYFDIPFDPPDITGGYFLEWQLEGRYAAQPSGFVTERSQAVVLRAPTHATQAQMDYISTFIQEMEDAIYSPTGYNDLGRHFTAYIDLRSIAQMYVFHEFLMNVDAGATSFFFYKESDLVGDGLLRAAPPWDFDLTLGVGWTRDGVDLSNPELFYVNQGRISWNPDYTPHILTALWQHEEFREMAMTIWNEEFGPFIEANLVNDVREHERRIQDSAQMEWIRWSPSVPHHQAVDRVIDFIERRIQFLNREWSH